MNHPSPTPLCDAALRYAEEAGWPVFPLKPKSKNPLTRHGFKDATTDPKKIEAWWTDHPDANIGLPTGADSGIVVIDVDDPAAASALTELGATVPTLTSVTARGWHLFFKHHGVYVKSRANVLPGVDVRGDGAYVVAPPSMHVSGHPYQWDAEHDMGWGTALAPMPPKLLAALTEEPTDILSLLSHGTIIPEGERNVRLAEIAGSFASRASTHAEVFDPLCDVNECKCRPPLTKTEVRKIAKSIWGRELKKRGKGGKPLPRWQNGFLTVDLSQLHLDTKDVGSFGYLIDLFCQIATNASMPVKTGKRTSRPARVANGRAEVAIRFLTNRWELGENKVRRMIKRWTRKNLVEVHPPISRGRPNRIELKGWGQFHRGVDRPFTPEVFTPLDAVTPRNDKEIAANTPPKGKDLLSGEGQQYTNKKGRGRKRWVRISSHLEVQLMVEKTEEAA